MGIVALEGVEFFAYHGYYDEEQKTGNRYSIDIAVTADVEGAAQKDRLQLTINYEELYRIIADEMTRKARLLEHIAERIIERTYQIYPQAELVEVSVSKFNPPIGGVCTRARVTLKK
jgi:dihydroneopterin aldolase